MPTERSTRINAIDAVRGLCLVNIFVNHVELGVLVELSPSKIAWCDSADLFVFLAGMSTFLAYGAASGKERAPLPWQRMWRRALTLYGANLCIIAASFAVLTIGAAGALPPKPEELPAALIASAGAADYFWHLVTLQQSVGYSMVLRLYVALMLVAPLYLWLARRRFWYPLVPAAAIWVASGHAGLVHYDTLTGTLLTMNVLTWQLVFAAGIALAAAISQSVRLPRSRLLTAAAGLVVVGGTLLIVIGSQVSSEVAGWLAARNDFFWTGISKSYQSPLRLLYLASLIYLVIALAKAPVVRLLHQARPDSLFCRLGRRSLPVFAFGAVFALAADQLLWNLIARGLIVAGQGAAIAVELALFATGLWLMAKVADHRRAPRPRPNPDIPQKEVRSYSWRFNGGAAKAPHRPSAPLR